MNQIIYVGKHLLTFSVTRHAHSSWELVYCTGGEGVFRFDELSLPYREGDLTIIPPFVPHRNESEQGFTNIHLNMLDPAITLRAPTQIRDDSNHFLRDAFQAAFYYFSSAPGKQSVLLSSYANLIVALIHANRNTRSYSPVVESIAGSIIQNYPDENYELDAYLHTLPFNYDYVRKLFKQELGVTPHRYLSDIRLQSAAENLALTDEDGSSISDIAHNCGFREPLYFSRMFRKRYGVSPSEYQSSLHRQPGTAPDAESIKITPAGV